MPPIVTDGGDDRASTAQPPCKQVTFSDTGRTSWLRPIREPGARPGIRRYARDAAAAVQRMHFTRRLREGIRRGRIRSSIRIWTRPHVRVGGRYRMDDGHIVVDAITPIAIEDVSPDLAQASGFDTVDELLSVARHGHGSSVYLIRFHYLRPGAWDTGGPR